MQIRGARLVPRSGPLFLVAPPRRYPVFLQHFLHIRAFGNPYARYRGSTRCEIRVP